MKRILSSRTLFLLALALVLFVNLMIWVQVAANRRGDPVAVVTLTERELPLSYNASRMENSDLGLTLRWQVLSEEVDGYQSGYWAHPEWLDESKLRQLGFAVEASPEGEKGYDRRMRKAVSREVFVVLELDGPAYQSALRRLESRAEGLRQQTATVSSQGYDPLQNIERQLSSMRTSESRLFAIDAGLDSVALRHQYANRDRVFIVRGLIEPMTEEATQGKPRKLSGRISRLLVDRIHVPLAHRPILDAVESVNGEKARGGPRYQVELAIGHRFEPWLVAVERMERTP